MGAYQAVIFDMDGVLVDSEPLYLKAINDVLIDESITPITDQENQDNLLGTTVEETWRRIASMRNMSHPLNHYTKRYDRSVRTVFKTDLVAQPGVARIVDALREGQLKAGLASSSLRSWIRIKLRLLGMEQAFDVVLGGDDVSVGKPAPDIYILAARLMGLRPERCIAIEDSPVGISAARGAGAYTIAVRTNSTFGMDLSQAHRILDRLEDFDLSLLGGR